MEAESVLLNCCAFALLVHFLIGLYMGKDFWVHCLILHDLALYYCVSCSVWVFSPLMTKHAISWFTSVNSVSIQQKWKSGLEKAPCQIKTSRIARTENIWMRKWCLTVLFHSSITWASLVRSATVSNSVFIMHFGVAEFCSQRMKCHWRGSRVSAVTMPRLAKTHRS